MDLFQIISSTIGLFSFSTATIVAISYGAFKVRDKKRGKAIAEKDFSIYKEIEINISNSNNEPILLEDEGKFKRIRPENFGEDETIPSPRKKSFSSSKFQVYNNSFEISSRNFR